MTLCRPNSCVHCTDQTAWQVVTTVGSASWLGRASDCFATGGTRLCLRETQQARSPQSLSAVEKAGALVAVAVAFECPDSGGGVRVP